MEASQRDFTVGLEEELFLVDQQTRNVVKKAPDAVHEQFQQRFPKHIVKEFLSSQVEIITSPHQRLSDLANEHRQLRRELIAIVEQEGLAVIAASTHPFAFWRHQRPSQSPRYKRFAEELSMVVRRLAVCGMHIHVGVHDEERRVQLNNALRPYLPLFIPLTASAPYWYGWDTGFNSYRLSVIDGLPRAGLPRHFESAAHYQQYLEMLKDVGYIEDASEIWWDSRLSHRYPTIELRITDTCTNSDDAISVAALYMSLMHHLAHAGSAVKNDVVDELISYENRWRSGRFGFDELTSLMHHDRKIMPYREYLRQVVDDVTDSAEALGCSEELKGIHTILARGTSADLQRRTFQHAVDAGQSEDDAFVAVVDALIAETKANLV